MTELTDRLPEMAKDWRGPMGKLVREAAAEITRLTLSLKKLNEENTENLDEIDRLTGDVSRLQKYLTETGDERDTLQWKADALAEAADFAYSAMIKVGGKPTVTICKECQLTNSHHRNCYTGKLRAALTAYRDK